MLSPYDRLAIPLTATPAEVKAAYHAKLREFPAHLHPEEFKEVRAAYETIRKGGASADDFFFLVRPLDAKLDPSAVEALRQRAIAQLQVSWEEMIRETF
ncbi:MAG: molecular chaperone DnaJ [Drouetiella hepatica Uher 2000/2452]|jgi:energy-converting hydrogenase Eha subunit F|uniref:Molecular chaperone DnaJ n=1 Tax=Drouetiella hepatica Uher 2000/2452 TaxID=904376 RepID=A0A951UME7_9CYAN|nr:molecular chaperone DnaJ [Drouetiella hepatica Uher 2000/2452]